MKQTESTRKTISIKPEKGDTLYDLYKFIGPIQACNWPIKIEDGAIVAVQPE